MKRPNIFLHRFRLHSCVLCSLAMMSACSIDTSTTPDPTATPTAITFGPNDVAVGELLDRSRSAWQDVTAWSSEARIDGPDKSENSGTESVTTEQVVLPSARRVLSMNGETIASEEIVVDGTVYMRGTIVPASIYPGVDQATWISFIPEQVPAGTPLEQRVDYLVSTPEFPFNDVSSETRDLPASPMGDTQAKDRTCSVYTFSNATDDEERINYRIAFDDQDRPCQLIKEGGGVVETTTWTYEHADLTINAPTDSVRVNEFPEMP